MPSEKNSRLVDSTELLQISRRLLVWLNAFPDKPVETIAYEFLESAHASMSLAAIQGSYITETDILGTYAAEYQFKVIYRIKPGSSTDRRLGADEALNALGTWAEEKVNTLHQPPELGTGITVLRMDITALSALLARYEDGDEDHQILMRMVYQVG